jgi:hypothetical protein
VTVQLLQQGPPPYIRFEERAEEDRTESINQKKLVMKNVDYVIVARAGRKDTHEQPVEDWLAHCERMARESPPLWPPEWLAAHRKMYADFKGGKEVTQPGFPIDQWAMTNKAQAMNLRTARIFTVEQLAGADEVALNAIGLGGRALRDQARAWMEANKDNKGAEIAALRADNATLTETVSTMQAKIAELEAALATSGPTQKRRA